MEISRKLLVVAIITLLLSLAHSQTPDGADDGRDSTTAARELTTGEIHNEATTARREEAATTASRDEHATTGPREPSVTTASRDEHATTGPREHVTTAKREESATTAKREESATTAKRDTSSDTTERITTGKEERVTTGKDERVTTGPKEGRTTGEDCVFVPATTMDSRSTSGERDLTTSKRGVVVCTPTASASMNTYSVIVTLTALIAFCLF